MCAPASILVHVLPVDFVSYPTQTCARSLCPSRTKVQRALRKVRLSGWRICIGSRKPSLVLVPSLVSWASFANGQRALCFDDSSKWWASLARSRSAAILLCRASSPPSSLKGSHRVQHPRVHHRFRHGLGLRRRTAVRESVQNVRSCLKTAVKLGEQLNTEQSGMYFHCFEQE